MRRACIAVGAAILLTGCGDDEEKGSRLASALDRVAVGETAAPAYVEWSDMAALRELAGLPERSADLESADTNRWSGAWGLGAIRVAGNAADVAEETGIDVLRADELLMVGSPPDTATVLRGDDLDTATVADRLTAAGGEKTEVAGRTFLAFGEEGEIDSDGPFADLGVLGDLNRVLAEDGVIAFGTASEPVARAVGDGDETLLDAPGRREAVECLGDVVGAILQGEQPLIAVGVREDGKEIVCVVGDRADVAVQELSDGFASGAVSRVTSQPWSDVIADADVERVGDRAARATLSLTDGSQAGLVFGVLSHDDLPVPVDGQ